MRNNKRRDNNDHQFLQYWKLTVTFRRWPWEVHYHPQGSRTIKQTTKQKSVKQTNKQTKPKQSNMWGKKVYRDTTEFLLCLQFPAWHGACPYVNTVWLIYPGRLHWRQLFFPCKVMATAGTFLVKGGSGAVSFRCHSLASSPRLWQIFGL